MKISYNWLKQFVDLKDISPNKLAHDLSLFGHEVESLKKHKDDYIFDLEITPNRGDCLSIHGIAREVSSLYMRKLNIPSDQVNKPTLDVSPKVTIESADTCSRFTARIIKNIEIKSSPAWIKKRLEAYGFRSLNNIIDITNYIMIETGQPLHAFDYDKISHGIVNIRRAQKGESVITLDGKDNTLDNDAIIINDDKKIYDLAGIMGGYNSEIDSNTKNILLQCSILNPILIRRTSKKLSKTTDASYRFERGVDPEATTYALNRATRLIQKLCPKHKTSKLVDVIKKKYKTQTLKIDNTRINHLLGTNLTPAEIKEYLARLNFKLSDNTVSIPSYRIYDVTIWQDVAEEIARIHGYNNLGQNSLTEEEIEINKFYLNKESLKDYLANRGFTEIYSHSFADEKLIKSLNHNINSCPIVINPIAPENKYLRPSLDTSILQAVSKNPWAPEINIFEIGKAFVKDDEFWQLAVATSDKKAKNLQTITDALKIKTEIKNLDQKTADLLKIRRNIKYFVCNLEKIKFDLSSFSLDTSTSKYKKISTFAPTIRDLAFITDVNTNAEEIKADILKIDKQIILVELFDEFVSDKFGKDKKNVAYHIWLQDMQHPITSQKSDIIIQKIIKTITNKYRIKLR